MQVKKFEASTIKEALEMVKNTLGPEAIILNAKDNTGSFGLMGRKSIEVTAAISEQQLLKKQWAESRLREDELSKHRSHSARTQKQFIQRSVDRYNKNVKEEEKTHRPPVTRARYIDIDDEENDAQLKGARGKTVESILNEIGSTKSFVENIEVDSTQRVKQAAHSALKAFEDAEVYTQKREVPAKTTSNTQSAAQPQASLSEVQNLKTEIQQLKSMLQSFTQSTHSTRKQEPDFKLHPGAEHGVSYEMSSTFHKLTQSGVSVENMLELLEVAKKDLGLDNSRKQALLEGWIAKIMMSQLKIKNPLTVAPVQIFLGPSGSGKSSTLVKIASDYVLNKRKKVGILTCDTEKVGSVEQLRTYSQILNIPFGILKAKEDWESIVDSLKTLDVILVDYPGFSLKEMDQIERLRSVLPYDTVPCEKHLVLSSGLQDKDAIEIAERYRIAKPTDVIFTKLDEAVTHGVIYNFQRKFDLPLHSFGVGPGLPEDFEYATKERVVDLIFKITKIKVNS